MNKIKSLISNLNNKAVVCATSALVLGTTAITHAAGETGADADVTGAFTTLAGSAVATIKGVALTGVGIMTVFLVWKYGKKIFNRVAN